MIDKETTVPVTSGAEAFLAQVRATGIVSDLVVVDDCSTDGTREILQQEAKTDPPMTLVLHERNRGKGAACGAG
jgi:glycosyltransferase involved in cell wall biosynthesis